MRLILVLGVVALAGALMTSAAPTEDEMSSTGEKWLSLLDNNKYEDSWTQAAAAFRDQVKQEQWVASLKRFREPLGALVSRTSSRVNFTKTLRGAPDGDYVIIHYTTSFKNKEGVTERLTLVKENDKWLASAYAIH